MKNSPVFVFGGALVVALLIMGFTSLASNTLYEEGVANKRGFSVDVNVAYVEASASEAGAGLTTPDAPAVQLSFAELYAAASAKGGEKLMKRKCKACHTWDEGGKNKVGPNLFGVLGNKVAAHEGYKYSNAMTGKASELGTWSYENLLAYLTKPKDVVPGTKMAFPGFKDPADIAAITKFLHSMETNFPEPK